MDVTVTAEMTATVAGVTVHPVYGTRALIEHVAAVCRKILEPHLEPGEEAIDVAIEVRHREPIPVGAHIVLDASVAAVEPSRITCEVMVRHEGRVAARGTLEQELVSTEELRSTLGLS